MIQIKNQGKIESVRSISILLRYFVLYLNKSNMNKVRIQNLSDFLNELFKNQDEEVWKNSIIGMRYLAEVTNSLSFLRKLIKKLIYEIENPEK